MADIWYTTEHDPATFESETERITTALDHFNSQIGAMRRPLGAVASAFSELGRAMSYLSPWTTRRGR